MACGVCPIRPPHDRFSGLRSAQQLRQLGEIDRNPPRLIARELEINHEDRSLYLKGDAATLWRRKVVRAALQNAASIAGLLITTEAMVAERPKKDSGAPAMPAGGMGGMDY
jgi:hypothetical protein